MRKRDSDGIHHLAASGCQVVWGPNRAPVGLPATQPAIIRRHDCLRQSRISADHRIIKPSWEQLVTDRTDAISPLSTRKPVRLVGTMWTEGQDYDELPR